MSLVDLTFKPPDPSLLERWLTPYTDPNWGKGLRMSVDDFFLRGLIAGHYLFTLATSDVEFGMKRRVDENEFTLIEGSVQVKPDAPRFNFDRSQPILPFNTLDEMNNRCVVFDFIRRTATNARWLKDCDFGDPIGNDWLIPWPEKSFEGSTGSRFTIGVIPGNKLTEKDRDAFEGVLPVDMPAELVTFYSMFRRMNGVWTGAVGIAVSWDSHLKCTNYYAWDEQYSNSGHLDLVDHFDCRDQLEQVWKVYENIDASRRLAYDKVFTYEQLDGLINDYKAHPFAKGGGGRMMSIVDFQACVRLLSIIEELYPDDSEDRSRIFDTVMKFGQTAFPHYEQLARDSDYVARKWGDIQDELTSLRELIQTKLDLAKERSAELRAEADRHRSSPLLTDDD